MIRGFDHIAFPVADLDAACAFYVRVLGARIEEEYEVGGRIAVKRVGVGAAIMNVHEAGNGIDLVARVATPGTADICFRWDGDVDGARRHLEALDIPIIVGPVPRATADGQDGQSVYFRDLDGNLIELLAA